MIFARERLKNKVAFPKSFSKKTFIETLGTWQIYVASALWVLHHQSWYSNGAKLYMKSRPDLYTTGEVTTWDSYMYCAGIPAAIIISPLCKYYGKMIPVTLVMLTAYYACIIFVIWDVPNNVLISAFFVQRIFRDGLAQVFYSWIAVLCSDNIEKKALVLSWVQALSYAINAFAIPLQYNTKYGPNFKKGYIINFCFIGGCHIAFLVCWFLDRYDYKYFPSISGHRREIQNVSESSSINSLDDEEQNNFNDYKVQEVNEITIKDETDDSIKSI